VHDIDELTEDVMIMWRMTGGEREMQTYQVEVYGYWGLFS